MDLTALMAGLPWRIKKSTQQRFAKVVCTELVPTETDAHGEESRRPLYTPIGYMDEEWLSEPVRYDIFEHQGKFYVNHDYPGQTLSLVMEYGPQRPTGPTFHYFKKRDSKEASSSSTTSSPQKKQKLAPPSPQKPMKPPTSGTVKTSPQKPMPAGPSAATAKSSPELPPLVNVKKSKFAVPGPEEKGSAEITLASREVADKDLLMVVVAGHGGAAPNARDGAAPRSWK
ncbi:hypothetical protein AAVH_20544 [Aphelenchoides avenae]|nr:hypothetical protein AAVH_20544 [Aphelenchus avenae]